jgi:hypothetical protein
MISVFKLMTRYVDNDMIDLIQSIDDSNTITVIESNTHQNLEFENYVDEFGNGTVVYISHSLYLEINKRVTPMYNQPNKTLKFDMREFDNFLSVIFGYKLFELDCGDVTKKIESVIAILNNQSVSKYFCIVLGGETNKLYINKQSIVFEGDIFFDVIDDFKKSDDIINVTLCMIESEKIVKNLNDYIVRGMK